jgi:hypothetical protein
VWRYLARRPARRDASAAVSPREGAGPTRRRAALGWGAAALASGAAFWLGWLRGRSDGTARVAAAPAGSGTSATVAAASAGSGATAASDAALAGIERFHAVSSHSRRGLLLRAPDVDWGGSPPGFKRYPGASRVALPLPSARAGAGFDLAALGHVLWHVGAVTERRGGLELRASPSSGALFPTELYVVCRSVDGVADGVWHYDAESHALESLGRRPCRRARRTARSAARRELPRAG